MSVNQVCIPFEQINAGELDPGITNALQVIAPNSPDLEIDYSSRKATSFFRRRPETMIMACLSVFAATIGVMTVIELGGGLLAIVGAYFAGGFLIAGIAGIFRGIGGHQAS